MTVVLIAVYVPIGFQGGLTGALFTEFAFTLVGAVTISAIVALTLSPMMSSRLLKPRDPDRRGWQDSLADFIDRTFDRVRRRYQRWLHGSLDYLPVTTVFALIVLGSIYFLYAGAKSELAPQEDQGVVIASSTPAPNATLEQKLLYSRQVYEIFAKHPETAHVFQIDTPGTSIAGMVFKPWDERKRDHERAAADHPATSSTRSPARASRRSSCRRCRAARDCRCSSSWKPPIHSSASIPSPRISCRKRSRAACSSFSTRDLKIDKPQSTVRDRSQQGGAARPEDERRRRALGGMLGGGYVNYFSLDQRSYKVIPQVQQRPPLEHPAAAQLLHRQRQRRADAAVDRSRRITTKTVPESLNHFQQLNSATIQGVATPGVAQADALEISAGSRGAHCCRRAIRSITAACRGNTCRNRAASSPPSDLR